MTITWYGHACFLIETAEGSVVFDPYEPGSVPGLRLPELRADAVVCSHSHHDHCYPAGVQLSGETPRFALRELPCYHDAMNGALRGENRIAILKAEGLTLAHCGDLGHELNEEQLAALAGLDVLLVPVGGHYTIDAAEAAALVRALKPRLTIPMHFRGEGFGYEVLAPVEDFCSRFSDVRFCPSNRLDLREADASIVVLRCPTDR